jgi:hypothetical protein
LIWHKVCYLGIAIGTIFCSAWIIAQNYKIVNYTSGRDSWGNVIVEGPYYEYPYEGLALPFILMSVLAFGIAGIGGIFSLQKVKILVALGLIGLALAAVFTWISLPMTMANYEDYGAIASYIGFFGILGFFLFGASAYALYKSERGMKPSVWRLLEKIIVLTGFFSLFTAWFLAGSVGTLETLHPLAGFLSIFAMIISVGGFISYTERRKGIP